MPFLFSLIAALVAVLTRLVSLRSPQGLVPWLSAFSPSPSSVFSSTSSSSSTDDVVVVKWANTEPNSTLVSRLSNAPTCPPFVPFPPFPSCGLSPPLPAPAPAPTSSAPGSAPAKRLWELLWELFVVLCELGGWLIEGAQALLDRYPFLALLPSPATATTITPLSPMVSRRRRVLARHRQLFLWRQQRRARLHRGLGRSAASLSPAPALSPPAPASPASSAATFPGEPVDTGVAWDAGIDWDKFRGRKSMWAPPSPPAPAPAPRRPDPLPASTAPQGPGQPQPWPKPQDRGPRGPQPPPSSSSSSHHHRRRRRAPPSLPLPLPPTTAPPLPPPPHPRRPPPPATASPAPEASPTQHIQRWVGSTPSRPARHRGRRG